MKIEGMKKISAKTAAKNHENSGVSSINIEIMAIIAATASAK